jgi:hypothetical protein
MAGEKDRDFASRTEGVPSSIGVEPSRADPHAGYGPGERNRLEREARRAAIRDAVRAHPQPRDRREAVPVERAQMGHDASRKQLAEQSARQ